MKKRLFLILVLALILGLCCTGCQRASGATLTETQIEQMRTEYPRFQQYALVERMYPYSTFSELAKMDVTPSVIRVTVTGDWKTETVYAPLIPGSDKGAECTGCFLPVRVNEVLVKGNGYNGEKTLNLFFGSDSVFNPDSEVFREGREFVMMIFEQSKNTTYTLPNQFTADADDTLYLTEDGALINMGYAPYMNEVNGMSLDGFRALVKQTFDK